jgi:hypothetical protein
MKRPPILNIEIARREIAVLGFITGLSEYRLGELNTLIRLNMAHNCCSVKLFMKLTQEAPWPTGK